MPASRSPGYADAIDAPDEDPAERTRLLRKSARLTCALGVAFVLFFVAGIACFSRSPRLNASEAELLDYYGGNGQELSLLGGLYLLPFAAVAFLWFIAALRGWVEHSTSRIDHLLSTVQMLSGVSFITLVFVAAGAFTVVPLSERLSAASIDNTLVRQFPLLGKTLLVVFGLRMAAIFVTSSAKIGGGARLYPSWFVYGSYLVAAILFLTATLNVWLVVVFPLWVAVLCGLIWQRTLHKHDTAPSESSSSATLIPGH